MKKIDLETVRGSQLHDYELEKIQIDYNHAYIIIQVSSSNESYLLPITNFISFKIERNMPWGLGKYIVSSDIIKDTRGHAIVEMQLDSGDKIMVQYAQNI